MKKTCENCRYGVVRATHISNSLFCVRFPPTGGVDRFSLLRTEHSHWCGEYVLDTDKVEENKG